MRGVDEGGIHDQGRTMTTAPCSGSGVAAAGARFRGAGQPTDVELSPQAIRIRRSIAGLDTSVTVPTQSYRGVTLRPGRGGAFDIVLLHVDPSLDVMLASLPDDGDVIALWRHYARAASLPLLVEDVEGRLQALDDAPRTQPCGRRRGSAMRRRRPRFLACRSMGHPAEATSA
jgi:hypothetical protein